MKSFLLTVLASVAFTNVSSAQVPSNDGCPGFGPGGMSTGWVNFRSNTENATDSTFTDMGACSERPPNVKDVFFTFATNTPGLVRFNTGDHTTIGYDTVMTAYSGIGCTPGACLGFNDDISPTNYGSQLELYVQAGDSITIQVGAWNSGVVPVSTNRLFVTRLDVPGDSCATAIPISGYGEFDYSNEFHSISPFPLGGCQSTGEDVYFEWTAPASASNSEFLFRFQPEPGFDHEVYSYSGCSGVCIFLAHENGCNGSSQQLFMGINAGDKIILKVAGFDSGDRGSGVLTVMDPACDPCANDDAFEENDDCGSAVALPEGLNANLNIIGSDEDYYTLCVGPGGTVDLSVFFTHANGDIDIALYDAASTDCDNSTGALAAGTSTSDDEGFTWTNNSGHAMDVILRVYRFGGQFGCQGYDIFNTSDTCAGVLTTFCDPATSNSTGSPAVLSGTFNSSSPGPELHLDATNGPAGEFGYFVVGTNSSEPGIPVGDGLLCMDTSPSNYFGRYNVANSLLNSFGQFNAQGVLVNLVGTSTAAGFSGFDVPNELPFPGNPAIMPGQTFHFQVWFRDTPAGTGHSNLTNGVSATF